MHDAPEAGRESSMKHLPELQALSPWMAAFGIAPATRIATPDGPRPACTLCVGDLVDTVEDGPQPLTDVRETVAAPAERSHYPVRIATGALGFGLPLADLELGPQHRILFRHIRVPLLFGEDAVLVRAKSLAVSHDGIAVLRRATPASYVHLSLSEQAVIYAEGMPVETVLPDGACTLDYITLRSWELMAAIA